MRNLIFKFTNIYEIRIDVTIAKIGNASFQIKVREFLYISLSQAISQINQLTFHVQPLILLHCNSTLQNKTFLFDIVNCVSIDTESFSVPNVDENLNRKSLMGLRVVEAISFVCSIRASKQIYIYNPLLIKSGLNFTLSWDIIADENTIRNIYLNDILLISSCTEKRFLAKF